MLVATLWQRTLAFLLDYLLIAAYLALLALVGLGLGFGRLRNVFAALFADPNRSEASAFVRLVAPVILYFALSEHSAWQPTWGKRRLGLIVTTTTGARLSLTRSLVRSLIKFAPWELTHASLWRIPGWPLDPATPSPLITAGLILVWVLVAVYLATMLASRRRQALYDWIAGSVVVRAEPSGQRAAFAR
jgi:uncharacterized RDD family membrane protein YckC